MRSSWTTWPSPSTAGGGGACSGSGSGFVSRPRRRSRSRITGLRVMVVGSSHRSRNTVSTSWTAGPLIAAWMSCQGGLGPYSRARLSWVCGSPRWSASSRREWHRSMPPTYAMSRDGSSRCRMTTSFWWCEPPVRTRMSRIASAPLFCSARPSRRFSSEVNPAALECDRQTSPRTSTPRSSARPRTSATSLPGSPVSRSSASPCQSVKKMRSPARVASIRSYSSAKYVAPWISGRTRLPSDQAWSPGCRSSSRVAGLPRSDLVSSHSRGSGTRPLCLSAARLGRPPAQRSVLPCSAS